MTNPSKQDIIAYITEKSKSIGLDTRTALATAYTESGLTQFINGDTYISKNANSNDIGIYQINDISWKDQYNLDKISNDWKYNIDVGLSILKDKFDNAVKSNAKNPSQSAYSAYNTGSDYNRYLNLSDTRDKNFLNNYNTKPWEVFSYPFLSESAKQDVYKQSGIKETTPVEDAIKTLDKLPELANNIKPSLSTFQNIIRLIIIAGICIISVILFIILLKNPINNVTSSINTVKKII